MQPTLFFKSEACGGYFDGRDLGAVLEREEPLPIRHAIKCSSSVAGLSARRRRASARWWRDNGPVQVRAHPRGPARRISRRQAHTKEGFSDLGDLTSWARSK